MRTCLILSSAIALVAMASTISAAEASGSYSYLNDENDVAGFFTLVRKETMPNGIRTCTILDRGETQAFRGLYPINKRGNRAQVINRKTHDESDHHHGPSFLTQESTRSELNIDLLELNTNMKEGLAEIEKQYLKIECDDVVDAYQYQADFPSTLMQTQNQRALAPNGLQSSDEVRKLVDSGPDKNRVSIVFMGDGYTLDEREKFFSDIQRLVNDMFVGDTFQSYLPLFNIYALFRPSKESGIGVNGKWKDTSFRLYRDGTELRGIYTADPEAARGACRAIGKYACDFPSLIGNDPY
ncbi:hypothetical protein BX616_007980, partial [Lobosporangium transversale]